MLKIAAYCPDKSRQAGTSESQYRAGIQLVREAICDMYNVPRKVDHKLSSEM
jgi:hypothetical protein